MLDRWLLRTAVALLGVLFGVVAVIVVALAIGLVPSRAESPTSTGQPKPAAVASAAPAARVATPTPPPNAVEVRGLAEMQRLAATLRGKLVRVTVGETEMSDLVTDYILQHGPGGVEIINTRVRLRPGFLVLTGTARQSIVSTSFTVTGHPVVNNGQVELRVDSVEPSIISQLGGIAVGQPIAVPIEGFEARSVDVVEGQMIATGTVR